MWKDIEGYEGLYQVSDEGYIRSLKTKDENGEGIILKPFVTKKGYCQVSLRKDNKREVLYIHRLVANNFFAIGFGETVNHIDGNKQNNNISNLELVTYSENNQHAYDTGLKGRKHNKHVMLSSEQIHEIRERGKYASYVQIAKDYGLHSPDAISNILNNKTYQDIN